MEPRGATEPGMILLPLSCIGLEDPFWQVLTNISGTGSRFTITDHGLTNATKFYRVRVE